MSIDFRTSKPIKAADLFDGRLEKYGIREVPGLGIAQLAEELGLTLSLGGKDGHEVLHSDLPANLVPAAREMSDRWLTDGEGALWVGIIGEFVTCLTPKTNGNKILRAISEAFDTDIFREDEPQYWGFATKEEWDSHRTFG